MRLYGSWLTPQHIATTVAVLAMFAWPLPGVYGTHGGWGALGAAYAQEDHAGGEHDSGHRGGSHGRGGHDSGHHDDGDDHASSGHHEATGTVLEESVFRGGGDRESGEAGQRGRAGGALEDNVFRGGRQSDVGPAEEDEDSDRRGPQYGGGREPGPPAGAGSMRGDLYGDLYIVLRDENGVPILDENGNVQPIDADGNLIPIDEEGEPVDEEAAALLQEVVFSRLSVARSPDQVIDHAYDEAIAALNAATSISLDASGRITVVVDGEVRTIDSPLENLALYETLLKEGYLPGFEPADGVDLGALAFLTDPTMTQDDFTLSAALYAAASDKATTIVTDQIVYMNAILGIPGTIVVGDETYVDYSDFSYDRASVFTGEVTYITDDGDGNPISVTESIMDAVFDGENYSSTDGGVDGYTQLADDARAVIDFLHAHLIAE